MNQDIIRLLPDSVANQIAAGEVIQRPASVVKELVENAVDAGAANVEIILKDAGTTLVQVVDDGCGMSVTDARMAFERHTTSKIAAAEDLFTLHTMGFRGEALASIAAIAQVDLRTMRHEDTVGTRLIINASRVESQTPEACVPGSNLMVKNLFFNVPARRKFLKRDTVELANIMHEFERLALVNTDVAFTITHNGVILHQLLRGPLLKRISELFGKGLDRQLLPVDTSTSLVRISGYVGKPENARRRNALQYLMVNGRNMRHPFFHKAVMECYQELIPADAQPNYFLNFTVDPATIDVNIHPQKHEIKFENEVSIAQILTAAVREALGKFNAVPAIDFDTAGAPEIPAFGAHPGMTSADGIDALPPMPQVSYDATYNPFITPSLPPRAPRGGGPATGGGTTIRPAAINSADWDALCQGFEQARTQGLAQSRSVLTPDQSADNSADMNEGAGELSALQVKGRWLVSTAADGLMVVDQHRAHTLVLYHRYMEMLQTDGTLAMQRLIFPEAVNLSSSESTTLQGLVEDLGRMGFDLSYLGDTSWGVNGVPTVVADVDPQTLVRALATAHAEVGNEAADRAMQTDAASRVALAMARQAAVRPGTRMSEAEVQHLLADLLRLPAPTYTPDGRKVMAVIPTQSLASLLQ